MHISESNLPALRRAGSNESGLLVAPITRTCEPEADRPRSNNGRMVEGGGKMVGREDGGEGGRWKGGWWGGRTVGREDGGREDGGREDGGEGGRWGGRMVGKENKS